MKTIAASALAVCALALMPAGANAIEESPVSYDDAVQCSALFSLLAGGSQGKDVDELKAIAARWLVVAMVRDGTVDGSRAEAELEPLVVTMIEILGEAPDEAAGEEFLSAGIDECNAHYAAIAEEFDSIELE